MLSYVTVYVMSINGLERLLFHSFMKVLHVNGLELKRKSSQVLKALILDGSISSSCPFNARLYFKCTVSIRSVSTWYLLP